MEACAGAGCVALWHGVTASLSVNWGTLSQIVLLVGVLALAWILFRGGVGTAVEGLQHTNQELQRQLTELKRKVDELTRENAELRGRTDIALAMQPVLDAMSHHERQAERRSAAMLDVLDLIATRLGKEPDQ